MESWFDPANVTNSTWLDGITYDPDQFPFQRLKGKCTKVLCRRFFLYGPRTGCDNEWFYLMVLDSNRDLCDGQWEPNSVSPAVPTISYSPWSGGATFGNNRTVPLADNADVLAVYVTFT
ncbi:hypothetical protein RRG08_031711 [Elysia crispata]|uniref:Uncharacterized protein n=1 Tax=Elysia crispata TaxID=231223 RepID=A0AAE0ZF35_9GAST|nr:hypothetical protein RRG08_031711 [Elysia crispata]